MIVKPLHAARCAPSDGSFRDKGDKMISANTASYVVINEYRAGYRGCHTNQYPDPLDESDTSFGYKPQVTDTACCFNTKLLNDQLQLARISAARTDLSPRIGEYTFFRDCHRWKFRFALSQVLGVRGICRFMPVDSGEGIFKLEAECYGQ